MARKEGLCFATLALLLALPAACSDDGDSSTPGGDDDGSPTTAANCLSRPGDLPRPPDGRLPCELIPPGLSLE
jgi:hypothetical protein